MGNAERILARRAEAQAKKEHERQQLLGRLGGRCSSPNCNWVNTDGTRGCADWRALQIDHKYSNGAEERRALNHYWSIKRVIADLDSCDRAGLKFTASDYQLLCANCNWIKRYELNENSRGRLKEPNIDEIVKASKFLGPDLKLLDKSVRGPLTNFNSRAKTDESQPSHTIIEGADPLTSSVEYVTPSGVHVITDRTPKV
jgi:hypothetical protein